MSTTKPITMILPDTGPRLADARQIEEAIISFNSCSSTYGITALGTTAATATQLGSVLNQIDTAAASTGVNLPLSTGRRNTPFQNCIIVNNGANAITVYGFPSSADTINGTAGATGISLPAGSTAAYVSIKGGAWFTGDVGGVGVFSSISASGNLTFTAANSGVVLKQGTNGRVGTFTANGTTTVTISNTSIAITDAIIFSLNTVGGTVGTYPKMTTITAATGFTIVCAASDTSIYNYACIGNAA